MGEFLMCVLVGCGSPEQTLISLKPMLHLFSMVDEIIRRDAWVLNYFYNHKSATLKQLNDAWMRSALSIDMKESFHRETWYNCFKEIGNIFGIDIECNRKTRRWAITNPSAIKSMEIQNWMLSTLSFKMLMQECMSLNERILLEEFPSENHRTGPIVEAMKNQCKLQLTYRKYNSSEEKSHLIAPFFICSYKHRFYLVGRNERKKIMVFSFDRIVTLDITSEKFHFPKGYSAKKHFMWSYGIMQPSEGMKPCAITIRAKGDARYYIADVPLHHTQQLIKETEDYADFTLMLYPTNDFIGDILQQAGRLEIISPAWLREKMKDITESMAATYK